MKILAYLVTHFRWFWKTINKVGFLARYVNRTIINTLINSTEHRPLPYSMFSHLPPPEGDAKANPLNWHVSTYPSWDTLIRTEYSNRLLPPASDTYITSLPDIDEVTSSFMRNGSKAILSKKSSMLFMGFAQWFSDAFLRVNPTDVRKNDSNYGIDLCQIYGLKHTTTDILRSKVDGKLKSQNINGKEYPPYLFDENGNFKTEFQDLPYLKILPQVYRELWNEPLRKNKFYVTGLERGNITMSHSAFNITFLRAHNKIAHALKTEYGWDDERLFQTTRNILILILIKIVIEDYINHISSIKFRFIADPTFAEYQDWYRTNWMSTEFNLLYRWHSLIPDSFNLDGNSYDIALHFRFNNPLLESIGVEELFKEISSQSAGKIQINNTPDFMWEAERSAIFISRCSRIRPYNEYRKAFGLKKLKSIRELTKTHFDLIEGLYKDINEVELTVGLFAEESEEVLGPLLSNMIAAEAFSHAFTNPLLSRNVYKKATFSEVGLSLIENIGTMRELVDFVEGYSATRKISFNI